MRHFRATYLFIAISGLVSGGCTAFRAPAPEQPAPFDSPTTAILRAAPTRVAIDEAAQRAMEATPSAHSQQPPPARFDASQYPELQRVLDYTPPALVPLVVQDIVEKLEQQNARAELLKVDSAQANTATVVRPRREPSPRPADSSLRTKDEPAVTIAQTNKQVEPATHVETIGADAIVAPSKSASEGAKLPTVEWTQHLAEAIESLEQDLQDHAAGDESDARRQALLRMLYVIADNRASAARPIVELNEPEREFWIQLLHGLSQFLNDKDLPLADRRATLALQHLRKASDQLASVSSLEVRNLAFCTRVDSYGRFTEFKKLEFRPDQEVLLYVEVDNFTAEPVNSRGEYETALQGSYHIYDLSGKRVAEHTFPLEKEICRNRRRDFFIPFRAYIPKIQPGQYRLQLTVEDVHGEKFGQAPMLDFTVIR